MDNTLYAVLVNSDLLLFREGYGMVGVVETDGTKKGIGRALRKLGHTKQLMYDGGPVTYFREGRCDAVYRVDERGA